MPLSTSLPAQPVEFYSDIIYPVGGLGHRQGGVATAATLSMDRPSNTQTPDEQVAGVGTVTGAGSTRLLNQVGGRTCTRVISTAATLGDGFRPRVWKPGYDAAAFNPGSFYEPGSVVASIDFHVAATSALFVPGTADVTGWWFQPRWNIFAQPNLPQAAPGGPAAVNIHGGFGVALNDDGLGNARWEYVSYDTVPNILQRTVIGAAFVPDVTAWTTFRWTIIGAASGRAATMSLAVNGLGVAGVQNLPFDDVTLFRPNTLAANAVNFFFGVALNPMGGQGLNYRMYARFGRFDTAGAELQAV